MVNRSVCGIAVYDLDKSIRSDTGMTYNYAVLKKKLPVTVIHSDTGVIRSLITITLSKLFISALGVLCIYLFFHTP